MFFQVGTGNNQVLSVVVAKVQASQNGSELLSISQMAFEDNQTIRREW